MPLKRELDGLIMQMHSAGISYTDAVRQFKRRFILEVLIQHKGNQCKAAEALGPTILQWLLIRANEVLQ